MRVTLASVSPRRKRGKSEQAETLAREYVQRANRLGAVEEAVFETEAALLLGAERGAGRTGAYLLLCDSRGDAVTSEEFAGHLGRLRDEGTQRMVMGIGPADGWSPTALAQAQRTVSFGRMTLPHELARVVLAEQVYRALTILAGHPYHTGHTRT